MLWILFGIFLVMAILGVHFGEEISEVIGIVMSVFLIMAIIIVYACYNDTKATADRQIAVLEQRNKEVLAQVEPLVKQYFEYESKTFKELKPNADKIIAFAQYPKLKGNEFIQTQIKIILDNQEKITKLKLDKAGLNAYKLWIFMGED